ncbi:MAG: C25 family cysteine peptidase [Acidobacteriota bacterium]|nr:C25 family cysteine peptidase [Acidobacteriota bacterium]
MKKLIVSLFLSLCICLLTVSQPSSIFASSKKPILARALSDGQNGVVIQWEIEPRAGNLGFNVYRIENNQAVLLNPQLIFGWAISSAEKAKYFRDNLYSFYDSEGSLNSHYVIEEIDLNWKTQKFSVQTQLVESILPLTEQQAIEFEQLSGDSADAGLTKDYPVAPLDKLFAALNENLVQNADVQKFVASQPGAKIAIKADGLYRVSRTLLAATNFNVNSPVANWQLYADGVEQSIIVEPNGEYIEFYGRGVDNRYTDTKYYYLIAGTTPGRRMSVNSRKLNNSQLTARSFSNNFQFKDRRNYIGDLNNGEAENFFGSLIGSEPSPPTNVVVNLKGVATNSPTATITLKVQGQSSTAHTVTVKLNNATIGTITGGGRVSMEKQFTVQTSLLVEGANTFSFSTAAGSTAFFDSVVVSYNRNYTADSNRLTFTTANGRATRVQGFTSSNIRVFDISNPNGTELVNFRNEGNGSILIPANRPQMLFAVGDEGVLQPAAVTSNSPSTALTSAANKDLVIISHGNFINAVEPLAVYRRGQGLTVEVVNVEDVFDESGFGSVTPLSISSFLQSVNPKYVLLVGDANYDQRNYQNRSFSNFVPSKNIETLFGEAVSDSQLADFNNDNIEDFPIGRFPVKTTTELGNIISKIQAFEPTVSTALLQKGALFVSDDPVGWDFYYSNQTVRNQLPAGTPVRYIRRSDGDAATVRQMIIDDINNGRFIVSYSGHGQIGAWWSTAAFRTTDSAVLANNVYPLFLPMNCLNGAFADTFSESLAEGMIKAAKGGVLAWSSSALTFPDQQELMALRFFKAIGTAEFARIGDAVKKAKEATPDPDVRRSWILLGDPTLKIR